MAKRKKEFKMDYSTAAINLREGTITVPILSHIYNYIYNITKHGVASNFERSSSVIAARSYFKIAFK